ncbi:MAG: arginine--tRNA ligase [Bacteroidota bacterium]|nr:arginine--tRNA ligase [Bacteroidota bacterium]
MIQEILHPYIKQALQHLYEEEFNDLQFQETRKEFEGDITLVVFNLLRISKESPEDTAEKIGVYLLANMSEVTNYNVVKGFLNLTICDSYWLSKFSNAYSKKTEFGFLKSFVDSSTYLVEFSSPNTNKPLHLGHIRNNLLGDSVSRIIRASGKDVKKVQIINDRGIHICKSMVAWLEYANGETPETNSEKGDHFVGRYYVKFNTIYAKEQEELIENGCSPEKASKEAPIFIKAQDFLVRWEQKDKDILDLWEKMNRWVYEGFDITYNKLGISFDKNYYESKTYLLGKKIVEQGLKDGIFFSKNDGSVWIDLTSEGFDQKILIRSDGTAVYMTQDIGTAIQRHQDFKFSHMIYVVGNEQDYHFQVLFKILEKLGYKWAKNCFHLSYGMVDLPSGKMKSREGTVVDADNLIEEMIKTSTSISAELGKVKHINKQKLYELNNNIALGALKYFILKVDPKKSMLFNPKESIDFNGNTGSFIQYTYARIQSILRKYNGQEYTLETDGNILKPEKEIIKHIYKFPFIISEAANNYSPAVVANYIYDLVKMYNNYYQNTSILNLTSQEEKFIVSFRVALSDLVGHIIKKSCWILGFSVPEEM